MTVGCSSREGFTRQGNTQTFVQSYNPPQLDVLWMVNDQSDMSRIHDHLVNQSTQFFTRLGTSTDQYRMALVDADMDYAKGTLLPHGNPQVLSNTTGTVQDQASFFGSIIAQIIPNLNVGPYDKGFNSVLNALTYYFQPRTGVPLVLVFISDADDHSDVPSGQDAVTYYYNQYLNLVGNDANKLRVYSINYTSPATSTNRCATQTNADIDNSGFQDRYFKLAKAASGSTADLCAGIGNEADGFSAQIDLSGLRLKQLPTSFPLNGTPAPSTIQVSIFQNGQPLSGLNWHYDAPSNSIVFDQAPPEGVTISVTYFSA